MSYNPTRAKNFYGKKRRRVQPSSRHHGIKKSDIQRRAGLGTTVPVSANERTTHGYAHQVFEGKKFTVRTEILAAGNATPFGINEKADRVYQVTRGVLFVTHEEGEESKITRVQPGASFVAAKGTKYNVASSTEDVEIVIIEDSGYEKNFKGTLPGTVSEVEEEIFNPGPAANQTTSARRKDQTKAKAQAVTAARKRGRRRPVKTAAPPTPAVTTVSGRTQELQPKELRRAGKSKANNANSASVQGVNPMPGGAGSYRD